MAPAVEQLSRHAGAAACAAMVGVLLADVGDDLDSIVLVVVTCVVVWYVVPVAFALPEVDSGVFFLNGLAAVFGFAFAVVYVYTPPPTSYEYYPGLTFVILTVLGIGVVLVGLTSIAIIRALCEFWRR
jgi:hypothetical protein